MYAQSDTLLPADIFNSFQNICIKIYGLDTADFLSAPGLSDIDMLFMVEEGIRRGICHAILEYAKANNKYMKDYDKIKNFDILTIRM